MKQVDHLQVIRPRERPVRQEKSATNLHVSIRRRMHDDACMHIAQLPRYLLVVNGRTRSDPTTARDMSQSTHREIALPWAELVRGGGVEIADYRV